MHPKMQSLSGGQGFVKVALSLKETRAIAGMANVLCDFLPGSGRSDWKGHVTFQTVAAKVGVGGFWPGGTKVPGITALLSQTLERRRSLFQTLVLEIVRAGIVYREKKNQPIGTGEIDVLNGCLLDLGFSFYQICGIQDSDLRWLRLRLSVRVSMSAGGS